MSKRVLTVLSAFALTAGAMAATAPSAAAAPICNTTSGGVFGGTTLCAGTSGALITWVTIPYSVGTICVGSTCTLPVSGSLNVPIANAGAVTVYGQLCVTYKVTTICVPF